VSPTRTVAHPSHTSHTLTKVLVSHWILYRYSTHDGNVSHVVNTSADLSDEVKYPSQLSDKEKEKLNTLPLSNVPVPVMKRVVPVYSVTEHCHTDIARKSEIVRL